MPTDPTPSIKTLVIRPHHTALCVDDFERARQFFVDFLGFTVEGEAGYRDESALGIVTALPGAAISWAMLCLGHYRLELFKYHRPVGSKTGLQQCDSGYTHMAFEVSDVDAVYQQVIAAGYRTTSPPISLRPGYSRLIYVHAPENAVIEFIQYL